MDLNNDADKTFIEKSFDWTLEIDGKKWADGMSRNVFNATAVSLADLCATHQARTSSKETPVDICAPSAPNLYALTRHKPITKPIFTTNQSSIHDTLHDSGRMIRNIITTSIM